MPADDRARDDFWQDIGRPPDDQELDPQAACDALEQFFARGLAAQRAVDQEVQHATEKGEQPQDDQPQHPRARALDDEGRPATKPQAERRDRLGAGPQE
jgi:hypothetical protein